MLTDGSYTFLSCFVSFLFWQWNWFRATHCHPYLLPDSLPNNSERPAEKAKQNVQRELFVKVIPDGDVGINRKKSPIFMHELDRIRRGLLVVQPRRESNPRSCSSDPAVSSSIFVGAEREENLITGSVFSSSSFFFFYHEEYDLFQIVKTECSVLAGEFPVGFDRECVSRPLNQNSRRRSNRRPTGRHVQWFVMSVVGCLTIKHLEPMTPGLC